MTAIGGDPRAHAPLALLPAAASGALGPAASIAVRIHASHCAVCATQLADLEAVGGAFLDAQEGPAFNVEASLADALAKLETPRVEPLYPPEVMAAPEELRPAFAGALTRGRWSFAGPGLRTLELDLPGAPDFSEQPQMLRIEPGYGAPLHGHGAMELTLVLHGAFRDETGVYRTGDLAVAMNSLTHRPIAEPGPTCLAYAVSYAPMKFKGILGMAQRLLSRRS